MRRLGIIFVVLAVAGCEAEGIGLMEPDVGVVRDGGEMEIDERDGGITCCPISIELSCAWTGGPNFGGCAGMCDCLPSRWRYETDNYGCAIAVPDGPRDCGPQRDGGPNGDPDASTLGCPIPAGPLLVGRWANTAIGIIDDTGHVTPVSECVGVGFDQNLRYLEIHEDGSFHGALDTDYDDIWHGCLIPEDNAAVQRLDVRECDFECYGFDTRTDGFGRLHADGFHPAQSFNVTRAGQATVGIDDANCIGCGPRAPSVDRCRLIDTTQAFTYDRE